MIIENDENNEEISNCELEEIFSRHKDKNKNESTIKYYVFNQKTIDNNILLLNQFVKEGYINKQDYYDSEQIESTKKDDYFSSVHKDYMKNPELYCGYLDNLDKYHLQKHKLNPKTQISCIYCFEILSNSIIRKVNNIYICNKAKNIFKDFLRTFTLEEISILLNISNNIKEEIFPEREKEKEKMFIELKCENCSNVVGYYDTVTNMKIIYNCI